MLRFREVNARRVGRVPVRGARDNAEAGGGRLRADLIAINYLFALDKAIPWLGPCSPRCAPFAALPGTPAQTAIEWFGSS